jgi:hypothetical protein
VKVKIATNPAMADTSFGDDAFALDTIQACETTVVSVTPKMREEWQHESR